MSIIKITITAIMKMAPIPNIASTGKNKLLVGSGVGVGCGVGETNGEGLGLIVGGEVGEVLPEPETPTVKS